MTEEQERLLFGLAAEATAHRAVISAIIASHSMPDVLLRTWNLSKPEWIDEHDDGARFHVPAYRDAYIRTLGTLTAEIEEAERLTRP